MNSSNLTAPIKWHGGKHYLAEWIISNMPPHLHYVEPFFGGGAVLLSRDTNRNWYATDDFKLMSYDSGCSEVVNDLNGVLTNFWRVLKNPEQFKEFHHQVSLTPFSQVEWTDAEPNLRNVDPVTAAVAFFVRVRQSRQGLMKSFATLSRNRTRRRMNEQVSSYLNAVDGLEDVHKRLQGVVILNDDACTVIRQQDGPSTLYYCDPPYLHETRASKDAYEMEMSLEQHEQLLETLSGIQGKFMLSGYPSSLYERFASAGNWRRVDRMIDNKSSNSKSKELKCECLWMNFPQGS